jgi:small nuclear ribonucleoprotein F
MQKSNYIKIDTISPRSFVKTLIGQTIVVKLKWNMEYRGRLISSDSYLNIRLSQAEEWLEREKVGYLGDMVIRCNNIKYISKLT